MFDAQLYRDRVEVEAWQKRGPLITLTQRCKAAGLIEEADFLRLDQAAAEEVERAVEFAEQSSWEPLADLERFVYAQPAAP
jgi:TPP-dependent pyruvate/acetoin dehydrogenase alpha subunit